MSLKDRIKAELIDNKVHYCALAAIITTGTGLRVYWLVRNGVENDEIFSYVYYALKPLSYSLTHFDTNNHPLVTLLDHLTTGLLGNAPWVFRIWVLLCGIAVIPLVYLVITRLYNKEAALLGAGLTACSLPLVSYSAIARGYMLQACIFLILILVSLRIKEKSRGWLWYVFLIGIGFYSVITFLYYFGAVFVWLLFSAIFDDTGEDKKHFIIKLLFYSALACILTLLLYLPFIWKSGLSVISDNPFMKSLTAGQFLRMVQNNLKDIYSFIAGDAWFVIMIILLFGLVLSIVYNKCVSKVKVSVPLTVIIWLLIMYFGQRVVVFARVLIPLIPVFFGCSAVGLYFVGHSAAGWLQNRRGFKIKTPTYPLLVVALVVLMILMVFPAQPYPYGDTKTGYEGIDYEVIAELLKDRIGENDVVYGDFFIVSPLTYYFERKGISLEHLYMNIKNVRTVPPDEVEKAFIITDIGYNTFDSVLRYTGLEYNNSYEVVGYLHSCLITEKPCLFEIVELETGNKI